MLDMSAWPRINVDVLKDVALDPQNVRLESTDGKDDAAIMAYLFAKEDALSLVKGICKTGYLTHEIPVVIENQTPGGNNTGQKLYTVVEGNRRFAALKAIQDPSFVREFEARITKSTSSLTATQKEHLSIVQVMLAPSLDEAVQLIAPLHTSNLRKPWNPRRQAAFFQTQIDSGRTLGELENLYPTTDVKKFVFRASVFNLFKNVEYNDPVLQDYIRSKQWTKASSVLARIYGSKDFHDLTGLHMDDRGRVTVKITEDQFKRIATVIVDGIRLGKINTRTLNSTKSPAFTDLMSTLNKALGDKAVSSTTVSSAEKRADDASDVLASSMDDDKHNQHKDSPPETEKSASTKSSGKKASYLDFAQIPLPDTYPVGVKKLLGELKEINVRKFPNTAYIAIRSVLEKTIKAFAAKKHEQILGKGGIQKKNVQLRDALLWLKDYADTKKRGLVQPIMNLLSKDINKYKTSKDSLDAAIHNQEFIVDPDQVFEFWDSITPIMEYMVKSYD
nr:hypothetical protein [Bifidobacterium indicum]